MTETDDLAVALNAAAHEAHEARRQRRLTAVRRHSGLLTGAYGSDYLHELREDWPA